jgi:6-pyruvoyltetrahydropterin/6-carboxytetrahydropterin synthase
MSVVYATRRFSFEAAHNLKGYEGKCSRLHGHSYKLEVTVKRDSVFNDHILVHDTRNAMVMDFAELKKLVTETLLDKYDHSNLNDFFNMPTAEHMVVSMYKELDTALQKKYPLVSLAEVKLWETEDSFASYRGE